ncbi:hypothetical protein SMU74_00582 [Streptococcus mutans M2A]|nr:hypothetical protein APQ13_02155 [Streptococcus mutans]EMB52557.1 hypothetical protein SMU9_08507 [Streptococcus mutans 1ID3]EMB56341.1 hypothetical protein SMU3_00830 [Streptococcus mutans 11A1]EMB57096.1 hypothetical protein SMU88_02836 [Streptococcus mutans NLML8]EMB58690.1 hypothetical protein SMU10_06230 [Streptococcus mutans 8ID3]EMB60989.1 hypothetical protein SMU20_02134 [Streptococcus mutans 15JP3]EMB62850.1 hypothetical protein SMU21_03166 [Streptococcus mutans 1SM1]EMB65143.1 h
MIKTETFFFLSLKIRRYFTKKAEGIKVKLIAVKSEKLGHFCYNKDYERTD